MNNMRLVLAVSTLVASGTLVQIGSNGQAWAGEGCNEASLNGGYGFYRSGVNPQGVLLDEVDVVSFDGQGHFSSMGWIMLGEDLNPLPFEGTYLVNPDCSYVGYNLDGDVIWRGVLVDGGKEVYLLRTNPGAHQRAGLKKM